MADQHLDLRSVASEAFYFADCAEKIRVDVVVLDDTSGLGGFSVASCVLSIGVRGNVFDAELLELVLINRNAGVGDQRNEPYRISAALPANGTDFPFFPRKPSFYAILRQILSLSSCNLEGQSLPRRKRGRWTNGDEGKKKNMFGLMHSPSCNKTSQKFASTTMA